MNIGKRLDEIFNAVKVAFIKKYERTKTPCCDIRHRKFQKDLNDLIKTREKQVFNHARDIALKTEGLTGEQITQINDRFNE